MSLYVKESGPKDAPTVVLLHGGGVSGWMWDRCVSLLKDYHCLVPDMPEHGGSCDIVPFTIEDSARRIAELIRDEVPGGRAHVIGHSLGGQVLVALLTKEPRVIDRAVVSSAILRPIPMAGTMSASARAVLPLTRNRIFQKVQAWSYHIPAADFETYYQDTLKLTSDGLGRILYENSSFRLPAGLQHTAVPTLVLAGEKELKSLHDSVRDLVSALPDARGCLIRGADHAYLFAEPEGYTSILRAWFGNKPLPEEKLKLITGKSFKEVPG